MKKLFFLSVVLVFCFTSCMREFFASGEERVEVPDVPSTTVVDFNNIHNSYAVAVFTSFDRNIQNRVAVVQPYSINSSEKALFPTTEGYSFFLTYRLKIEDVFINYSPQTVIPSGAVRRNQSTTVLIPPLSAVAPASGPLVNDVYLAVKNDGFIAFRLGVNTSVARDVNGDEIITPGKTGVYIISPGNSSSYRIMVDAYNYNLESVLRERGNIYSYTFNGSEVVFNSAISITSDNVQ